MPTTTIQIKFIDGTLGEVTHHIPMSKYAEYNSKIDFHKNKLTLIKSIPLDLIMTNELTIAESEFKDFLANIDQEVKGCYDLLIVDKTKVDYTTP